MGKAYSRVLWAEDAISESKHRPVVEGAVQRLLGSSVLSPKNVLGLCKDAWEVFEQVRAAPLLSLLPLSCRSPPLAPPHAPPSVVF